MPISAVVSCTGRNILSLLRSREKDVYRSLNISLEVVKLAQWPVIGGGKVIVGDKRRFIVIIFVVNVIMCDSPHILLKNEYNIYNYNQHVFIWLHIHDVWFVQINCY